VRFLNFLAASRIELDDGTVITACDQCQEMYSARNPPGTPPCDTCRVDLLPANQEVGTVFQIARHQVIVGGMNGEVVDLNLPAVKMVMDLYDIKDQRACLNKVRRTFYHFLAESRAEAEAAK
jgi:hypothetical protein